MAVINWIKSGKLEATTTPGGHRRVSVDHFRDFLQRHGLPPFAEPQADKCRLLVVDDDPEVVRILVKLLGRSGKYAVATAANGFEAGLQVARFGPELVILDLVMPQRDGFAVCQQLKATPQTRHIKVLVLTGYASAENLQRALAAGADDCLAKPLKGQELQEKIDALLPKARTAS
jgi:CheY-like chemotaxis protein